LTARLDRLVDEGMLERTPYEERPPRYECHLTDKGRVLWDDLAAMWRWGEDWLWPDGGVPPVKLVDRESGADIRPVVVDEQTGERLDVRRTKIRRR
jgi:DNA-binding HxlR family transcriptional regulator